METQKQTYNILNFSQKLKLIDFLKGKVYPDGTTAKQIAKEASATVGFVVTSHNLKHTANAAEIELPLPRAPKVDPTDELRAAIITLKQRVDALEDRFKPVCGLAEEPFTECWPAGSDQAA